MGRGVEPQKQNTAPRSNLGRLQTAFRSCAKELSYAGQEKQHHCRNPQEQQEKIEKGELRYCNLKIGKAGKSSKWD
jgi:hypothetical protein